MYLFQTDKQTYMLNLRTWVLGMMKYKKKQHKLHVCAKDEDSVEHVQPELTISLIYYQVTAKTIILVCRLIWVFRCHTQRFYHLLAKTTLYIEMDCLYIQVTIALKMASSDCKY